MLCFVLAHTIMGSIWTAWPFDAQLHWVAWAGPIVLLCHIVSVAIQRYLGYKHHKEIEALPPEERPKPPMQNKRMRMTEEEKKKFIRGKTIGFWGRWVSGVLIVILLAAHIVTNSTIAMALLMVAIGVHAFYAMGCLLMDLRADREKRGLLRCVSVIVAAAILIFFLWARSQA